MRNISDEKVIKITFFFSLFAHCLFLGLHGFNSSIPQPQKPENITVEIKIEKPPLLPKIDMMGNEKKLREIVKEELSEPEPEPKSQSEKEKIVEELEQQSEEIVVEETKPKPLPKEIVEVINPQEEAILRYQDMVKQKIESCRQYPSWARKRKFEGISYIVFTLLSNGVAEDIKFVHSSGFDVLDREAVSTVKRASPFKPIPEKFNCSRLTMEVAIVFQME